jgi:chemotaxis family two-component system response regulator Rcp1
LVEDCEPDARLFSELLADSSSGYRLSVVNDGEQAVDFLQRRNGYSNAPHPHLIFLDLNLPKRTGFEILQEIRSMPVLRPTPVVVLTSSQNENDVNAAYRGGANLYLRKPSTLEQFESLMQAVSKLWLEFGELPRSHHDSY